MYCCCTTKIIFLLTYSLIILINCDLNYQFRKFQNLTQGANYGVYSPNQRYFFTITNNKTLNIYNAITFQSYIISRSQITTPIKTIYACPNPYLLVVIDQQNKIDILSILEQQYNNIALQLKFQITHNFTGILLASFSLNGNLIAVSSITQKTINIWSIPSSGHLLTFIAKITLDMNPYSLQFSQKQDLVVAGIDNQQLIVFKRDSNFTKNISKELTNKNKNIIVKGIKGGSQIVVGSQQGLNIQIFKADTLELKSSIEVKMTKFLVSENGLKVVTKNTNGEILGWSYSQQNGIIKWNSNLIATKNITNVELSSNGNTLVLLNNTLEISIYSLCSNQQYYKAYQNECSKCRLACSSCFNTKNNCFSCNEDYSLSNNKCSKIINGSFSYIIMSINLIFTALLVVLAILIIRYGKNKRFFVSEGEKMSKSFEDND